LRKTATSKTSALPFMQDFIPDIPDGAFPSREEKISFSKILTLFTHPDTKTLPPCDAAFLAS